MNITQLRIIWDELDFCNRTICKWCVDVGFPHHIDELEIEAGFRESIRMITNRLNWINNRLTEAITYAEQEIKT